jgi:hypothetical protein
MNWDAIGAIGEIVGATGVIVTLLYLATQIRLNTKTVKGTAHQTQMDSTVALNNAIATDEKLAALIASANQDYEALRPGEQIQLRHIYFNFFNLWHSAFWNHRNNLLPHHAWRIWNDGMGGMLTDQIAARRAWQDIKAAYDDEFQAHVALTIDALDLEAPVGSGVTNVRTSVT